MKIFRNAKINSIIEFSLSSWQIGCQAKIGMEFTPLEEVIEALHDPMTDKDIPKAGHNLKYDFVVLARYGLRASPLAFDSMIAEWLINPNSRNLGLKNLVWVRLGHRMTDIEELIGKGKKQISMADVPIADVATYAGDDAAMVMRLIPQLKEELENLSKDQN